MGVSGVGKSVVGRLLAERLRVAYVDGDDLHPADNVDTMRSGRPLSEGQRAPWLEAVARWLSDHDETGGVVSCSALRRAHRDVLRTGSGRALFLHLTGDPALIRRRMEERDHFMPAALLDSQLADLEPPGRDEQHRVLDVAASPDDLVAAFLDDV